MVDGNYQEYIMRLAQCLDATQVYGKGGFPYESREEAMQLLKDFFLEARQSGKRLFFIGNGGSAAIASHMTADFMKNGRMRTVSLYDGSVMTCMGNDYGYEHVFSRPLKALAEEGDLLAAISSSGNSQNIVNAIQTAKEIGMRVVTLSGFERENRIIHMGEHNIHVPVCHYGIVESIHNLMLQWLVDALMECE